MIIGLFGGATVAGAGNPFGMDPAVMQSMLAGMEGGGAGLGGLEAAPATPHDTGERYRYGLYSKGCSYVLLCC